MFLGQAIYVLGPLQLGNVLESRCQIHCEQSKGAFLLRSQRTHSETIPIVTSHVSTNSGHRVTGYWGLGSSGTENLGKAVLTARLDRQDSQASGRHVA